MSFLSEFFSIFTDTEPKQQIQTQPTIIRPIPTRPQILPPPVNPQYFQITNSLDNTSNIIQYPIEERQDMKINNNIVTKQPSGFKGLSNPVGHHNCFLNVVIQVLWNLEPFRYAFISLDQKEHNHAEEESCVFCALKV